MVTDGGRGGEAQFLHLLSAPNPYPRKHEWESWRARLNDPRHPPKFARGRERQVPVAEQRDSERSEICNAALWLIYNDSTRRAYSENDFAASEWERVVRPLNFQNSKIADLLGYLAKEKLTAVEPRNEMAQTVKYYWHDQAKLCEDIMFYLLRRDVYLASFYAWFNESIDSIPNADDPFGEQIVSFAGDFLVGPVWNDPIRQLGLSLRATLPLHPIVRNAFDEIDRREAGFWADLLQAVAAKNGFRLETSLEIDLVDRIRMLLEGAQLRYAMWGKEAPREHLVAVGAVRDLVFAFAERHAAGDLADWDYGDAPQSPDVPADAFEEEMGPPDEGGESGM